jgi:hypothetical protein
MNQRALALAEGLRHQLAALGPGVRSVSVHEFLSWTLIQVGVATDDALRALAADLGLAQARTAQRGRIWWREASSKGDGLLVVAAGPHHEGTPPAAGKLSS